MKIWMRLATRFMWSRRKGGLLSILSVVSLGGISLGIMIPIIAISVLNGLQDHMKVRLAALQGEIVIKGLPSFRDNSHFWIESPQKIITLVEQQPEVQQAYACYQVEGILVYEQTWKPVMIHGVPATFLQEDIVTKRYYTLREGTADISGVQRINIGVELGNLLNVRKDTRAKILIFSKEQESFSSTQIPVKVTGIFKTGLLNTDHTVLYTSTKTLQQFLHRFDQATEIRVRLQEGVSLGRATEKIQEILLAEEQNLGVFSWKDFHKNLLLSLEVESLGIWIVMFFILLVGVFNIVGSQTLLITEKKREIGILKTIGITPGEIRNIFLTEGLLLTAVGSIIGGTFGCIISLYINEILQGIEYGINGLWSMMTIFFVEEVDWIRLIPEGVYYLEGIPVSFQFKTVAIIIGLALVFTVFASIIPAHKAAYDNVISSIQSQE